jgi:NAD(P)-dependent dehydrogenase (short-subunit alcohol dehydrogenase family)
MPEPEAGALVVGGASGIGAAVADAQRAAGIPTIVWDRTGPADVGCDVEDPDAIDGALAITIERIGVPTVVTVTAGVGHAGLLLDVTPDAWDAVMRVNARGPWLVMRAVARAMVDAAVAGSIVATSSVSAHLADRNMGVYCASKAALGMVVRVAASEWGEHGIRVNAVGPGVTETAMLGRARPGEGWLGEVAERTPLGRLGRAEDVADAALALHELEWVTGQVLDCDGGLALHSPIDSFGAARRARRAD